MQTNTGKIKTIKQTTKQSYKEVMTKAKFKSKSNKRIVTHKQTEYLF